MTANPPVPSISGRWGNAVLADAGADIVAPARDPQGLAEAKAAVEARRQLPGFQCIAPFHRHGPMRSRP
jgi:hypothetical protein